MENREFQRLRQFYLRCSIAILLFGPTLGNFVSGVVASPFVLAWLPLEFEYHNAITWVANGISTVFGVFGRVMLVQLLVWWVWRDVPRSNWLIGGVLLTAMIFGCVFSIFGFVFSSLVFDQSGFYFELGLLEHSLSAVLWMLGILAVFWLVLVAAQAVFAMHLVDLAEPGCDRQILNRKRTWSIRQLMVVTLVLAVVIAVFQALIRQQQQAFDEPFAANVGWVQLTSITTYCLSNLIVLWAAVRYCMGRSALAGYLTLVVAAFIHLVQQFATSSLFGSTFAVPVGPIQIVNSAILIATTFGLHVWVFRRWEQAGYKLVRVT